MTKYFCDRCGKDVTDVDTGAVSGVPDADTNGDGTASDVMDHLCVECYTAIWTFARAVKAADVNAQIAAVVADYVRYKRDAAKLRHERVISYCHRAEPNNGQGEVNGNFEYVKPAQEQPCWKGRDGGENNDLIVSPENWCEGCKYRQQIHELYRAATKQRGIAERRLLRLAKKLGAMPELALPPRPAAPVPEPVTGPQLTPVLATAPDTSWSVDDDGIPY